MSNLTSSLRADFPGIKIKQGDVFLWAPAEQTVFHPLATTQDDIFNWSLLHEVSHGALGHTKYKNDFELVQLEVAAWDYASKLAPKYGVEIDQEHVQDCLDTYRDWLHRRSTCPNCNTVSVQRNNSSYTCFNCNESWTVSKSRFCRPYRRVSRK